MSEPEVGSVTPKACSRSSPLAIKGSQRDFWASLPCRSSVPIVYIWAWQAAPLPPQAWISSRMAAASISVRPLPPYSSGIKAARKPASVSALTNSAG